MVLTQYISTKIQKSEINDSKRRLLKPGCCGLIGLNFQHESRRIHCRILVLIMLQTNISNSASGSRTYSCAPFSSDLHIQHWNLQHTLFSFSDSLCPGKNFFSLLPQTSQSLPHHYSHQPQTPFLSEPPPIPSHPVHSSKHLLHIAIVASCFLKNIFPHSVFRLGKATKHGPRKDFISKFCIKDLPPEFLVCYYPDVFENFSEISRWD